MTTHEFGGDWTQKKLKLLADYLPAFMTIMRRNRVASTYFKTMYVDAFAGIRLQRSQG